MVCSVSQSYSHGTTPFLLQRYEFPVSAYDSFLCSALVGCGTLQVKNAFAGARAFKPQKWGALEKGLQ